MKSQDIICPIKDVDIFKELSTGKVESLKLLFRTKKYKKKTLITKPGERGKVYVVKNGRVELYDLYNGKKIIFSILKHGMIFGDFDLEVAPVVFARTIDDSEICEINTKSFIAFILGESKLLFKLFQYFFSRLLVLQRKVASFAADDVSHRLIKLLFNLGRPIENNPKKIITDKFTHEQLSQMLGVSRQTISTILSALQKRKAVKRKNKTFLIDILKLKKISEELDNSSKGLID